MRSLVRSIPLISILLFALLSAAPSEATVNEYVEDFTTKLYCDTFNTTADWDTLAGEIKLFVFEITLIGSCDTP
ncbi:hypothetical protein KAT82_08675, partial [bacterium]|nr:hypothetical protein [bacterium]